MKILLLTPYTGGNLGDAAIQEAAIANIRKRLPNVRILLITLSPDDTSRLHGVPSFPIGVTTFGPGIPVREEAATPDVDEARGSAVTRRRITVDRVLRALGARAARASRAIVYWTGLLELGHITRALSTMRGASMLVVSGGGQLDDYWGGPLRHPYALLKWTLIARAMGARVVYLSVGTCSLGRLSRMLLRIALPLAAYRSFRDAGSKSLASFASCTTQDEVRPDLAFSCETPSAIRTEGVQPPGLVLGVSPIAYLSRIWPESDSVVYTRYLQSLADAIAQVAARGHRIVLFTSDPVDCTAVSDLCGLVHTAGQNLPADRVVVRETFTLKDFFGQILRCDLFVASRLHGVLLANLVGTPTLAISYDRKVDAYMQDAHLARFCVDIRNVSHQILMSRLDELAAEAPVVRRRLREMTQTNRRHLEEQYDRIFADVTPLYMREDASPSANYRSGNAQRRESGASSHIPGVAEPRSREAKPD